MARRAITELHHNERRTLVLLRGGAVGEAEALIVAFQSLRRACADHDVVVSHPGMRQASSDEVALLGWLSKLQRKYSILPGTVPDTLVTYLGECAARLRDSDIRLPQRGLGSGHAPASARGAAESLPVWTITRSRPSPSDARTRARSVIGDRDVVSASDFVASGISRQCLSNWCRDGLLERVSTGWYRARPALAAALS
ncbi:type IV toxin-antitoxin system AbiEi family antitoxin domain-containing protein [Sphingomonas montanisoli]|uniref:Type IV toxin-antitoxin system AbiEi family antitoxin domain-containing protein n=1 Tax=Sphingomonas montanisoli TaxID=2606412 RepID=A0A5D9CAL5_9SPHN|nr:type IV toxin-antitoxin system AbiEi family antitoxin domain-containing protein [Sphingomonas montanisoli]TZG27141.1 type IV toxin-antitoxin system AbiEi family antitoxin domain-containing protein [Sphingomonas montanisoli]